MSGEALAARSGDISSDWWWETVASGRIISGLASHGHPIIILTHMGII